jgi:hypothetical protein
MTSDTYNADRDIRPEFLETVRKWLASSGEVFVFLRYLRAAGNKGFAFCRSFVEFEELVKVAPKGTGIEVFRDRQLPYRGVVSDDFIADVLLALPDGTEFLIVSSEMIPGSILAREFDSGESHVELREALQDLVGCEVAVGLYPPFWEEDSGVLISAAKGGIDGPR